VSCFENIAQKKNRYHLIEVTRAARAMQMHGSKLDEIVNRHRWTARREIRDVLKELSTAEQNLQGEAPNQLNRTRGWSARLRASSTT